MNRPQNISITTICKSPMWYCIETHKVSGENRGWVEETSIPLFSSNSSSYIAILPLRDSTTTGHYRHLALFHILNKSNIPLTFGKREVRKLVYWDQIFNWM